jgi:hypothetical protein
MRAHLRYFWFRVVSSLWLVPVSMIGAAVLLAFSMLYLGRVTPPGSPLGIARRRLPELRVAC